MRQKELISIIVPVYNVADYLPRCLETIAAQTYHFLEIIVVDDGSTDHSGKICDEFAKTDKRAIVVHQNNVGLWAARNVGQRISRGNYLMFIDGDDYLHLDAVKTLYQAINSNKGYDIAMIDYKTTRVLDEDIQGKTEGNFQELTQAELVPKLLSREICRNVWNKLYRRILIENIYANDYPRSQDLDFNIRVFIQANNAIFIRRKMYFWVQRATSLSNQHGYWDILYWCHCKMFYENYINLPNNKKKYGHYLLSRLYKEMVFLKNRNFGKEREEEVFSQCRKYEIATRKAYWLCWRINPLEKIGVTILLHNPRLTRWLMRVTKNY